MIRSLVSSVLIMRATLEDEVPHQMMKPTENNQAFQKELEEQGRLSMVTADTHICRGLEVEILLRTSSEGSHALCG